MLDTIVEEYFGKDLYKEVQKFYVSKIISLMIRNKNLVIVEKENTKEYYLDWLKFYKIYKDIEDETEDETLKKYHFDLCEVVKFDNAKEMYKYIVYIIKKGIENEKDN